MGRKLLFITTDQQRYDALGCNGNDIARTPVVDRLAAEGINYRRAYNQNTVCMPARSTMLTGQYVRTHGVFANGVQLPHDAPSVAAHLAEHAGYRTALLGKAHFDPGFDPMFTFPENAMAGEGSTGPLRGFEHAELAMHAPTVAGRPFQHYGKWLAENHPDDVAGFAALLQAEGGGDTGAPETKVNPIPRDLYHTDWVADRTIAFLESLDDGDGSTPAMAQNVGARSTCPIGSATAAGSTPAEGAGRHTRGTRMRASVWNGPLNKSPYSPCSSPWSVVKNTSVSSDHPRPATVSSTRPHASSMSSFITCAIALTSRSWSSVSVDGTNRAGPPSTLCHVPS